MPVDPSVYSTLQRQRHRSDEPVASTVAPLRERLLSLDVFRGITVAGMLLVNDPGSWGNIYKPLEHEAWNGWTPTDLIFPFFLFIVGITTELSLGARRARGADDRAIRRQILRRGLTIIAIGLLLSAFPFYPFTWITTVRIPGVLQRIGLAYLCGALLTMRLSLKQQIVMVAVILYGYWFAMTLLPTAECTIGALCLGKPDAVLSAMIDRAVFSTTHLWKGTETWDPEGLFTTLPAIGSMMLGTFAGKWIRSPRSIESRLVGLFGAGAIAAMLGAAWGWSFPINKNLWTSSYVLFTAGLAALTLATCMWLVDDLRLTRWTKPFVAFGINPIVAFAGSEAMARLIYTVIKVDYQGKHVPLETAIYKSAFASWLEPKDASLAFAICFVLVWYAILLVLQRRNIVLKV